MEGSNSPANFLFSKSHSLIQKLQLAAPEERVPHGQEEWDRPVCPCAANRKMSTGQARKEGLQHSPAPETSAVQKLKPTLTNRLWLLVCLMGFYELFFSCDIVQAVSHLFLLEFLCSLVQRVPMPCCAWLLPWAAFASLLVSGGMKEQSLLPAWGGVAACWGKAACLMLRSEVLVCSNLCCSLAGSRPLHDLGHPMRRKGKGGRSVVGFAPAASAKANQACHTLTVRGMGSFSLV